MNKQLWVLRGMNFSYYAAQAVLLPYLPIYFEARHYTPLQIGLLMSFGPFIAVFAQPLWGYLSDRLRTVKAIIALLWTLMLISSLGLFTTSSYTSAFWFIMLVYFFQVPSAPLLDSLSVKAAQASGVAYGSIRTFGSIGFTTMAFGSQFLLTAFGGIHRLDFLFWGIWVLPFVLLLFLKDDAGGGERITLHSVAEILRNRSFLWFLLLVFLLITPHRMNDSLFGVHLSSLGAASGLIATAWAIASISEIPTFAFVSRYFGRFRDLTLLGIVGVLYTIRWVLYAFVKDPYILAGLQAMHSVTFAAFWVIAVQHVVRLVPRELQTSGQSLLGAVFLGLAGVVGGTVGGSIQNHYGGTGMYVFGAILAALAAALLFATASYRRKME